MGSIHDLPQIDPNHDIEVKAEVAFTVAVNAGQCFKVQGSDTKDYGTDLHLEARDGGAATNLRVQVQLKGTTGDENKDGSVSVQVQRANLNYLIRQRNSLYVCYHIPSSRLLYRFVQDVYRDYEHGGGEWQDQDKVTVRFHAPFDRAFQERWHAKVLAEGRRDLGHRLDWSRTPPDSLHTLVSKHIAPVEVPHAPAEALNLLKALYERGLDREISASFELFAAVLDKDAGQMDLAYMAEVNIGINSNAFHRDRVREAVGAFQACMGRGQVHPGSLHYCIGNAWLALEDHERARDSYLMALPMLDHERLRDCAAQCSKNMGAALQGLGKFGAERALYERALELDPDLGEAHLALGLWHRSHGDDPSRALAHLDRVAKRRGSSLSMPIVQGWRLELLFRLGDSAAAFREVQALLDVADELPWVWPWCAKQVAAHGRGSPQAARHALAFWRRYLRRHPDDLFVKREVFFCQALLHSRQAGSTTTWSDFAGLANHLVDNGDSEAALIWDRLGHWAQDEGDWGEAEAAYRKAFELEPARYGYCLGTALNFLDRFDEALPILEEQAAEHQPDALSWFQVARAREGTGDIQGAIRAYGTALDLDPKYDLAWFNLGGLYWNAEQIVQAVAIWKQAIERFPNHELADRLRSDIPVFFGERDGGGLQDPDQ